jgi:hypothetical protein
MTVSKGADWRMHRRRKETRRRTIYRGTQGYHFLSLNLSTLLQVVLVQPVL